MIFINTRRMTMRYTLVIAIVAASLLMGTTGCNKPAQPVDMSASSEPDYNNDKPMLNEVRPVDSGTDSEAVGTTPPLSEAASTRTYVVQKGDTYWRIAATQLGNGHRWKEIESLNPGVNMNTLKVGQSINIPAK